MLDLRQVEVNAAEVYQYDWISQNLKKYVIEKHEQLEIIK